MGLKEGQMISSLLFNILVDGVVRAVEARMINRELP